MTPFPFVRSNHDCWTLVCSCIFMFMCVEYVYVCIAMYVINIYIRVWAGVDKAVHTASLVVCNA